MSRETQDNTLLVYEFAQNVATSGLLTAEEMIPIYNKFNGVQSPDLKWTISEKRFDRTTSKALPRKIRDEDLFYENLLKQFLAK